jgi:signal transduction histidine kinase
MMTHLSIRTRLILGLALPALLIVTLAGLIDRWNRDIQTATSLVQIEHYPITTILDNIRFQGSRLISSVNESVLDYTLAQSGADVAAEAEEEEESGEAEEVREASENLSARLAELNVLMQSDLTHEQGGEVATMVDSLEVATHALIGAADTVLALEDSQADVDEVLAVRAQLEDLEIGFLTSIDALVTQENAELAEQQALIAISIERVFAFGQIAVVSAIGLLLTIGFLIYRSIARPLNRLTDSANALSMGNFATRTGMKTKDEIGVVGSAFDGMATTVQRLVNSLELQVAQTEAARAKAENSDKAKTAFLASVSHELRTPLNAILNFTQFVSSGMMGDVNEQQKDALTKVYTSGTHLLVLINDVLDIAKIEADSIQLFFDKAIDVRSELMEIVPTAEALLMGKPVRLHTDIAANLPPIAADRQRLRQVLINLVSNACKFTDEGDVTVRARQENEHVIIEVEDTGPGILESDQEHVFNAFRQGYAGLQHGGTGLGLPISKRLTEAHGGRLWFTTRPGQGSTFFVRLPITQTNTNATTEANKAAAI